MKHRLLMEHSGVDTRLVVFCLAREHSVFVSTPSMKHVTLCYHVAGRDYFVQNSRLNRDDNLRLAIRPIPLVSAVHVNCEFALRGRDSLGF